MVRNRTIIENLLTDKININYYERLVCFFFAKDFFSIANNSLVEKVCSQRNKTTQKTHLSRTQGNQAFVRWGDLDTTKINLCLLCFLSEVARLCNLFHYKDQMQRSLVLDCFFRKKVTTQNLWRGNGRSRKATPRSGTNKSKNKKEELSKAFIKLQFDEATVVKLNNFCSVCPEFPSLAWRVRKENAHER